MSLETKVRGDEVIEFLRAQGAERTDASQFFPGGRHQDNIRTYINLMEAGEWEETKRPIILDAKTGTVWKGTDRCAAINLVDWSKAPTIPWFNIIVEHPRSQ